MRLAWLAQHLWPETVGGVELQGEYLTRHLRALGHDVSIWVTARPRGFRDTLPDGRRIVGLGRTALPGSLWRFAPLWKIVAAAGHNLWHRESADAVICADQLLSVAWMFTRGAIPLIFCPGGTVVGCLKWDFPGAAPDQGTPAGRFGLMPSHQYLWAERYCLAHAAGIAAVSAAVKRQMIAAAPACAPRVHVIHNGYEPADFFPAVESAAHPFTAIYVGRLHRIKNIEHLLRAWALVRHTPRRLRIVGDGEEMAALRTLAGELRLDGLVEFLGTRHDVAELLRQADVFVLTSLYEACSLVVTEALGTGLPCLTLRSVPGVSDVGPSGELNIDGATGFCVDPLDPADLAARLDFLAAHPDQRRLMGEAGRRRALELFTWADVAKKYLALAEELTGNRR